MTMENETCTFCGKRGHWRPDCPEIATIMGARRQLMARDLKDELAKLETVEQREQLIVENLRRMGFM